MLHGTKTNFDCSYYRKLDTQELQWNFTCMQNGRVVHYFEYKLLHFSPSTNSAVVVGVPSKPPAGNPPSLEEAYIKHELGAWDR